MDKALTHRSSASSGAANERLEYLGDAVLGLVVSEFLYKRFPDYNEGNLTKLKASLVNEAVLSRVAGIFKIGNHLYLSAEEEKSGGRQKPSILADAMEALIGAMYLDGGLSASTKVIHKFLLEDFESLAKSEAAHNYKGELLEYLQGSGQNGPRYELLDEIGPDHIKEFVVSVMVNSARLGTGKGSTKKEAEQRAAKMALEALSVMAQKENK